MRIATPPATKRASRLDQSCGRHAHPDARSVRRRAGSPAGERSARASAARCCSPPDNCRGRWSPRSERPTRSSARAARSTASRWSSPLSRAASMTLSAHAELVDPARILFDQTELPAQRRHEAALETRDIATTDTDAACRRAHGGGEQAQDGRLACAARPAQDHELAALHGEARAVEHRVSVPRPVDDLVELQQRLRRRGGNGHRQGFGQPMRRQCDLGAARIVRTVRHAAAVTEPSSTLAMVRTKRIGKHKQKGKAIARAAIVPADRMIDRELSQLAFNERVLALAANAAVPLAERLRFVCIVSSNLDEFFEIRLSSLIDDMREGGGWSPAAIQWPQFERISARAHALVDAQYRLYNDVITPQLARADVEVLSHAQRTPAQRRWVREYFENGGQAAAGADRPRSGAPVPPGPQQVAELHHPARGQGRIRACLGDHDSQGAARASARHCRAGEAGAAQAGVRAAVLGDPRASRRRVSRPHRLRLLAVPRDARLGPVGRRARGPQPAPGPAHGADAAALRQRRAPRDPAHLPGAPRDAAARAVRAAERGGVSRQRPGQPRAHEPARRPARDAEAALAAVHARAARPPAESSPAAPTCST